MDFSDPFWDTPGSDVEFSPTWEEFAWSFVKLPGHLALGGVPTTEELLYFNMHMVHFGIHYGVLAALLSLQFQFQSQSQFPQLLLKGPQKFFQS